VEIYTSNVAAARWGAAFSGTCTPWTSLSVAGTSHAHAPIATVAADFPEARRAALRPVPAPTQQLALMAAELLPTVSGTTANDARKQTENVHKTRSNAGGYGAMGPYPEREQPA